MSNAAYWERARAREKWGSHGRKRRKRTSSPREVLIFTKYAHILYKAFLEQFQMEGNRVLSPRCNGNVALSQWASGVETVGRPNLEEG